MGLVSHWAVGANLDMGPKVLPLGPEDSNPCLLAVGAYRTAGCRSVPADEMWHTCVLFRRAHASAVRIAQHQAYVLSRAPAGMGADVRETSPPRSKNDRRVVRRMFYMALGIGLQGQPPAAGQ